MDGSHTGELTSAKLDFVEKLPLLSRAHVELTNRISNKELNLTFQVAGYEMQLQKISPERKTLDPNWSRFVISSDGMDALVHINVDILPLLLSAANYTQSSEDWSETTKNLVMAHFLNPLLASLGGSLFQTCNVALEPSERTVSQDNYALWFSLKSDLLPDPEAKIHLSAESGFFKPLLELIETQSESKATNSIMSFEEILSWRSPCFEIPVATALKFRVGDVVLLDRAWPGENVSFVWLGRSLVASVSTAASAPDKFHAEKNETEFGIEDQFNYRLPNDETVVEDDDPDGEYSITQKDPLRLAENFSQASSVKRPDLEEDSVLKIDGKADRLLNNVPVTLSVEFDRITKPLAELSDLGEGAILPFKNTKPERVSLLANGKRFADGELVRIDDQLGVRLTRMV